MGEQQCAYLVVTNTRWRWTVAQETLTSASQVTRDFLKLLVQKKVERFHVYAHVGHHLRPQFNLLVFYHKVTIMRSRKISNSDWPEANYLTPLTTARNISYVFHNACISRRGMVYH